MSDPEQPADPDGEASDREPEADVDAEGSEADVDDPETTAATATGREIWIEKYRPQTLREIHGQEEIVERLESYIAQDDLPHLLFSGPAGVGKCVTGDTPVLTGDGIRRIEDVVGDIDGFSTPQRDLEVATLTEQNDFEYVSPSDVFAKEANELVTIRTRDGGEFRVTPEHKLRVITKDGFEWVPAADTEAGDRVARPLSVPTPESPAPPGAESGSSLRWFEEMDPDRTEVTLAWESLPDRVSMLDAEWATGSGVNSIPLSELRACDLRPNEWVPAAQTIEYVNAVGHRSRSITPPTTVTPELARFLGLAISEARIDDGRIKFYNTDEGLLEAFESAARTVFEVDTERGCQHGVPYVRIGSRTLTHYLESVFDVFASASGDEETAIGSAIVSADDAPRAAFLRAVFDAEAHVGAEGTIELIQRNPDHITLVSYLLSTFEIPCRRKTLEKAATNGTGIERTYHAIYLSGASALETFADRVGFSIGYKADRLHEHAAKDANPNHDTIPAQTVLRELCGRLDIPVTDHLPKSLNPETPGRERYCAVLDDVVSAAADRIEEVQRALERLDRLEPMVTGTTSLPAAWIEKRSDLEPIETRSAIAESTGVRSDRLLEYSDGRRTPYATRALQVLEELDRPIENAALEAVQTELRTCRDLIGASNVEIAEGLAFEPADLANLLEADDHAGTVARFETVAERLREVALDRLSVETIELLNEATAIADADLYYDRVESVERIETDERVYDLTVPGTRNYVAGNVPTVMHNTTSATAIAREIYGDDWRGNFLELNASDQRGIDVVRDRIKNFARSSFGGYDYRLIFLDEADSLCVPPGTEVVTGYPSKPKVKPIEEVSTDGEPIPSVDFETNEIQSDAGRLVDSGIADFFEIELDDGRTFLASPTHPFFVVGEDGRLVEKELRELSPGDEIADFKDDIGVSRCEVCGSWTAGRFCSIDCKNEGHSREMSGENNPMHGTEWSQERREKIVEALSDGRLAGERNPNYGGDFHGTHVWDMDEETVERVRESISEMRSGTPWEEWVVDADAEETKRKIGAAAAEWWRNLDADERAEVIEKSAENCDYPVCDITGDNNPMRDPEIAAKVSEALKGHEPTGGNVRHSEELGHLVRSDWEYEVGKKLQEAGIEYEYEPAFELSDSVYHPDFVVGETVIEVKGVAKLWGQTEKVEEFLETYGDKYTFIVVGDGELPHHEHYEKDEFEAAVLTDGGLESVRTVQIDSIEYSHRGKAYNISMEGTPNFMLANGVLTHNTDDAQSALRRTMEQFSDNTRFILSCNYSSKIIDPIQSRCAVFRFSPLSDEAIAGQVREIAAAEDIEVTDAGVDALVYAANGDMRRAINSLQAAATTGDVVDEEAVYAITATARPEEIESMVTDALSGDFSRARATLDTLLTETGMAGGDVIDQLHRSVWEFDLTEREAVRLMERIGEADYRITEGANEQVQLESLLAALSLPGEDGSEADKPDGTE
ncbi:replication factor C small subunit [Halopenitus salinus]|uniref:Replication factor C small subunit n=1 Tax=Halopenitus salinus TaxID=1198295 RepID=A0ABD5URY6_9EURY